jgi:TPR repeat protein
MNKGDPVKKLWRRAVSARKNGRSEEAMATFQQLVSLGDVNAIAEVANIYEFGGGGVEKDFELAIQWYTRSKNEAGDEWAYIGLARMFFLGKGVERNYEFAFSLYEKIANTKNIIALYQMGVCYLKGYGVEHNQERAFQFFEDAAARGHVFSMGLAGMQRMRAGRMMSGVLLRARAILNGVLLELFRKNDLRLRTV